MTGGPRGSPSLRFQRRTAWPPAPGRHRLLGADLHEGFEDVGGLERRPAREALVEDGPQRVHVRRGADVLDLPRSLFGGHVRRRSHDRAGPRQADVVEALGQAEVSHLRLAVGGEQDVGRLQVAVDHALVVGGLDGPGQRLDQRGGGPRRHGGARQAPVETPPLDVLQGQE
jgi:hypothetical protein